MARFRADTLSFTLPDDWSGVTFGQFVALSQPGALDSTASVIATLTGLTEDDFRPLKSYDLNSVVRKHLTFLYETAPELPEIPKRLTVMSKQIDIPQDLGAFLTYGQMSDIELAIREKQRDQQAVDPLSLADTLLPVCLWSLLRDEPYKDRYDAAELWPQVGTLPCSTGLALAGFFLQNALTPAPSGRINIRPSEAAAPMSLSRWPWLRRPKWLRWNRTSPRFS